MVHPAYVRIGNSAFSLHDSDGVVFKDGLNPLLSVAIKNHQLLVSTTIREPDGRILAELKDNEWKLNPATVYDRNYTDSVLEVRNQMGDVVLQVAGLQQTIYVTGIFRCKNGWSTLIAPTPEGTGMDIRPPGVQHALSLKPFCEYPSERHLGSCGGVQSLIKEVRAAPIPLKAYPAPIDLCPTR
jgi:hypothetical protein